MNLDKLTNFYHYFDNSRFTGAVLLISAIILIVILYNFIKDSWLVKLVNKLMSDTLKKGGKFSRVSLTMFTSFWIANYFAIYDFIKNGFNFEVFMCYLGIATGIRYLETLDKKNNKTEPKEENTEPKPEVL